MTVEQAISDISSMSPQDQLRVLQAIWEQLPERLATELSLAQRQELDRRWHEYQSDPGTALSEQEFRDQVRAARQSCD